jgi:hypothetical protein
MGTESRSISESTYVKNTWIAAPMQRMPNTVDNFHLMLAKPGGTNRPRAKLNSQLPTAAIDYASQYISGVLKRVNEKEAPQMSRLRRPVLSM